MTVYGQRDPDKVSDPEVIEFIEEKAANCQYVPALKRWLNCFPTGNVYVGSYDNLCTAPNRMYRDVCRFLGISIPEELEESQPELSKRINKGRTLKLKPEFADLIARRWADDMRNLETIYPEIGKNWERS
jgi:hypothetical protein